VNVIHVALLLMVSVSLAFMIMPVVNAQTIALDELALKGDVLIMPHLYDFSLEDIAASRNFIGCICLNINLSKEFLLALSFKPIVFNYTKPFWRHVVGRITYVDSWELYVWPFNEGMEANKLRFTFNDTLTQNLIVFDIKDVAFNNTWINTAISIGENLIYVVANTKSISREGEFSIRQTSKPICLGGSGALEFFTGRIAYILLFNGSLSKDLLNELSANELYYVLPKKPSIFIDPTFCVHKENAKVLICRDVIDNGTLRLEWFCMNITRTDRPFLWIVYRGDYYSSSQSLINACFVGFSKIIFDGVEIESSCLKLPKGLKVSITWHSQNNAIYLYSKNRETNSIKLYADLYTLMSAFILSIAFIIYYINSARSR